MKIKTIATTFAALMLSANVVFAGGNYIVNTSSANLLLRSGAGSNYSIKARMPKGTQVYVNYISGAWANVTYNGITGFASAEYLAPVNNTGSNNSSSNANSGANNQGGTLKVVHIANGVYSLHPRCAERLALTAQSSAAGANVYVATTSSMSTTSKSRQKWKITRLGSDEWYKLEAEDSGHALNVHNGINANGTNVSIWPYGGYMHQYRFLDTGNGYYVIQPRINGSFVLDVAAGSSISGTNVQIYNYYTANNPAQEWKLVKQSPYKQVIQDNQIKQEYEVVNKTKVLNEASKEYENAKKHAGEVFYKVFSNTSLQKKANTNVDPVIAEIEKLSNVNIARGNGNLAYAKIAFYKAVNKNIKGSYLNFQSYSKIIGSLQSLFSNNRKYVSEQVGGITYNIEFTTPPTVQGNGYLSANIKWPGGNGSGSINFNNSQISKNALQKMRSQLIDFETALVAEAVAEVTDSFFNTTTKGFLTTNKIKNSVQFCTQLGEALVYDSDAERFCATMGGSKTAELIKTSANQKLNQALRKFIKNNIPNGEAVLNVADTLKKIKDDYNRISGLSKANDINATLNEIKNLSEQLYQVKL